MTRRLLVHSARQIVTVSNNGEQMLAGERMKHVTILNQDGDNGLSLVVDSNGDIEAIGYDESIKGCYGDQQQFDQVIDASGKVVLPGLVDAHTHPVWAGDRVHEFAMKLGGATYMDIHQSGGGIGFTVEQTRQASEDELGQSLTSRLWSMLRAGTTLVECKSGYGLNTETELKMLRVIDKARKDVSIDISSTYCGAHSVPKGMTSDEATDKIINQQIPQLKQAMDRGEVTVDNIDVFCEKGVFSVDQTRQILKAGVDLGLAINFHGEELNYLGSAEMGGDLGARAMSHLEEISDAGIHALAKAGTVGVILPTTAYILRLKPPPVRKMIDSNMAVALGTDFNPNAFCLSMPLVMHLACVNLQMTLTESLVAATLNAAASLGLSKTHGSLEVGKKADLIIINAPRWEHLIYQLGNHHELIEFVVKEGKIVKGLS